MLVIFLKPKPVQKTRTIYLQWPPVFLESAVAQLPPSLSELVPKYLPQTPLDPFSGEELRYRRHNDLDIRWPHRPPDAENLR